MTHSATAIVLGATGAVGSHLVGALCGDRRVSRITTLVRRAVKPSLYALPEETEGRLVEQVVDVLDPARYEALVAGHDLAFCTLGVGEPSKMSKEEFRRIDHDAALAFARVCRAAAVRHFSLLTAVASNSTSKSFYLRTKGQLEEEVRALAFPRTSIFRPSMLMTDENRYGFTQAVTLAVFPYLDHLLLGGARKFRSIHVEELGRAMAKNALGSNAQREGFERLEWSDFQRILQAPSLNVTT